ncbi:hypothetical protein ACI2OX_15745 [Bacillus sp. N9]
MNTRVSVGVAHLLEIIESRPLWSIEEIISHPEVQYYGVDINILLEYLIDKNIIHTIEINDDNTSLHECLYTIKNKMQKVLTKQTNLDIVINVAADTV